LDGQNRPLSRGLKAGQILFRHRLLPLSSRKPQVAVQRLNLALSRQVIQSAEDFFAKDSSRRFYVTSLRDDGIYFDNAANLLVFNRFNLDRKAKAVIFYRKSDETLQFYLTTSAWGLDSHKSILCFFVQHGINQFTFDSRLF
jgi:hypothetical protein